MSEADFLRWLVEANGYVAPVALPGGRYACVFPRGFNAQLITGRIGDRFGWADAW
jgi:hypothetical protein